jgi:homospermidine synthase
MNKFVFIGFGAVASALVETFNLEKVFYMIPFYIIEPKDINIELLKYRNYKHIQNGITLKNHKQLLKDIDDKTLVIDLSVEVDSIMLIKYCKEKGSFYLNTSVENWSEFENPDNKLKNNYEEFKNNTLYHRELIVDEILKNTKKTRIVNMGFNPGFIQEYCKLGIKEYAKLKGKKLINGNYARLGSELGLKSIFIVEYDTQKTNIKPKKDTFYGTWSTRGFESEASDYVMVSLNNDDIKILEDKGVKLIKPTDGDKNTHIRFLLERGMNVQKQSKTLDHNGKPFNYNGMLIPHAEIVSMSNFFNYKGDSPTIMYIYRPVDIAIDSLKRFRDNNYHPLKNDYVLQNKDILPNGYDSIGALMTFDNGEQFWAGSVCSIEDVRKLGYKFAQATTVQVAGSLYSTILFIINNPNFGFNEPETLKSAEIFKYGQKFMGKTFFKLL